MKDQNLNIRLSEDEAETLKVLAERDGLTVSAFVRRIIHVHARKEGVNLGKKPKAKPRKRGEEKAKRMGKEG